MALSEYLAGAAFFLPMVAAVALGALLVLRGWLDHLAGVPRALAYAVVATYGVIVVHVAPAMAGILSRSAVLACAALGLAATWALSRNRPRVAERHGLPPGPPSDRASIAIALTAVAMLALYQLGRLRELSVAPLNHIDVAGFHLPGVARWIQSGSLWQVDQFYPRFATGQYPHNGDFLNLSVVLPWEAVSFVRPVPVIFFALAGVAAWALAVELGSPRASAAVLVAAALAVVPVAKYNLEGMPDAVTLAMLATGVLFLVRHAREQRRSDLLLAGLALGVGMGSKWYGLTDTVAVLGVWTVLSLLVGRGARAVARDGALLTGMLALGGGIWLLRNLIESGNPIYPKAVSLLGVTVFAGSRDDVIDEYGYAIADYFGKPSVLEQYVWPGLRSEFGLSGLVIGLGVLLAIGISAWSLRRAPRRPAAAHLVLGTGAIVLAVLGLYTITPGSAYGLKGMPVDVVTNVRWLGPALLLGAAVAAWATGRLPPPARIGVELLGLVAVVQAVRHGPDVGVRAVVTVGVALLAAAFVVILVRRRLGADPTLWRRPAVLALGAAVLVGGVGVGRLQQERFLDIGYADLDPVFARIQASPSGQRIGLVGIKSREGINPVLPAFGPRLRNRVVLIGRRDRASVVQYRSQAAFLDAVRRDDLDLLLVARGVQPRPDTRDERWVQATGFRRVAESSRLALYAAPGR